MKRTIPQEGAAPIRLYTRTYYSLLRSSEPVQIRSLEETHIGMHSSLHPHAADARKPDMSAFIYTSMRLPTCILDVQRVVLGQSEEVFRRRGYAAVEAWQHVTARARRRRMFYDGRGTLAAYIASISDIDDLVPILTAFQIEWNKMHRLLALHPTLVERLHRLAASGEENENLMEEVRRALNVDTDDWRRVRRVWEELLPSMLAHIADHPKRIAVQLLAGSHLAYRRATQRWWKYVVERHKAFDLSRRPTYFISSNTHSVINMLTGFARRNEDRLLAYLHAGSDRNMQREAERLRAGERGSWDNFLYYLLKKCLASPDGAPLLAERRAYERAHGITRIPSQHTFDLEVQVIDLARLDPSDFDPRLRDLPHLSALRRSSAIILNIDYPLGFAAYHLLTRLAVDVGELRGAYIIGKAATLNGRIGDVLIPNVVYDEHSGNIYLFRNALQARDVAPYLIYGDVLDNQRAITVRGTFLENREYMECFLNQEYTDVEMEAGPYLSALYEFVRPQRYPTNELINLHTLPFEIGILHYASDTPMSKGKNLGARNLSYYGMDPTYASTVAVLRRILSLEAGRCAEQAH